MDVRWQGCARLLLNRYAKGPTRRRNRDITGKSTRATFEVRESNRNESRALRNLIEIRHALSLGKIMLQEPFFPNKFGSRVVGIQRFVSMHQNVPIQVQVLECRQGYARERLCGEALGIVPL